MISLSENEKFTLKTAFHWKSTINWMEHLLRVEPPLKVHLTKPLLRKQTKRNNFLNAVFLLVWRFDPALKLQNLIIDTKECVSLPLPMQKVLFYCRKTFIKVLFLTLAA